jgi:hypothetical protein
MDKTTRPLVRISGAPNVCSCAIPEFLSQHTYPGSQSIMLASESPGVDCEPWQVGKSPGP